MNRNADLALRILHNTNRALAGANLGDDQIARVGDKLRHLCFESAAGENFPVEAHTIEQCNFTRGDLRWRRLFPADGDDVPKRHERA